VKVKWTKADALRAEKMGFCLTEHADAIVKGWMHYRVSNCVEGGMFPHDREAAEWVLEQCARHPIPRDDCFEDVKTCRKAVLICCLGGER
jgi:hypothetical protein